MGDEDFRRSVNERLGAVNERLDRGDRRFDQLDAEVAENTRLTRASAEDLAAIRDVLTAVRGGLRVLGWLGLAVKWLGGLATAGVAIYTAWYALTHGGDLPRR